MYERLAADPSSFRTRPSTLAGVALAVLVLAAAAAYLTFLVWASVHASGAVEWFLVVLGWAVAIVVRPRWHRLDPGVTVLSRQEYPGLYGIVGQLADAVGVRPPAVLAVDLEVNAYVTSLGVPGLGRTAIVLGLPLFSTGSWEGRLGVLGHELGHLRAGDTVQGRLVTTAWSMLDGVRYLLTPEELDHALAGPVQEAASFAIEVSTPLARGLLALVAMPVYLVELLLERLMLDSSQHREYLADRRSAQVLGSNAVVECLLQDPVGLLTVAGAAARRGEDPFEALLARPPLTAEQLVARKAALETEPHRADATHPPDGLRIRLVEAAALPPGQGRPEAATTQVAEAELIRLRAAHRKRFADLFKSGRH